ncbi:uncharacterized protein ATNIH1004_009262 [Aspergillus tanneri]|uniref:Tse2 ADP-ribosyltransferase toxin domain-containing protein n=1 Tax=Aspergillus tanneri TaxID=1220188 RepID=A0A5M9MDN9_9EURO|nr:uncharacterized protein ATNIH1004_009262 [Aspergillus tanneri]KAA8645051.1 hypothetical protein ATNIH1004_009262 [Aspergillus tanneri]
MSRFIARFSIFPKELFRLNNGNTIRIRDRAVKRVGSFDVTTEDGKVKPKAVDHPDTYQRTRSLILWHDLVKNFIGKDMIVYSVPLGTKLPDDLTLVHEKGDHFSLQPTREMTLEEFNSKINEFYRMSAKQFTREQWLEAYPSPSETA